MFANIQKAIGILIIAVGFFVIFTNAPQEAYGQALRIITPTQGGTGIGSALVGDIGDCLKVSNNAPFTYELGACGTGGGGGGGGFPIYFQNGGATLNTATTTINFTANSFSVVEDPTDTLTIRVSTTTLGLLTTDITEGSKLFYTDARVSSYLSASTTYQNLISFYTTPSTRITAGTGIDWSGNTLNGVYTAGVGLTLNTEDFVCDTATGSVFGCITAADWTSFNSRVSSTSIDTSAELLALVTDETGTGSLVFGTSPTLSSTTLSGLTAFQYATGTSLTLTNLATTSCDVKADSSGNIYCGTDATGGGTGTSTWLFDVIPTGTANGVNLVFTIPQEASQVIVYADGIRAEETEGEFTHTVDTDTITFTSGRQPYQTISVDYLPTTPTISEVLLTESGESLLTETGEVIVD